MTSMPRPDRLPLITLRGHVLLPGMQLTLTVGRPASVQAVEEAVKGGGLLLAVTQKDPQQEEPATADLFQTGTVARVREMQSQPDGLRRVVLEGGLRAQPLWEDGAPALWVRVVPPDAADLPVDPGLVQQVRDQVNQWCARRGLPQADLAAEQGSPAGELADRLAGSLPLRWEDRQALLDAQAPAERLRQLLAVLNRDADLRALNDETQRRARAIMEKNQRQHFLREQLKLIQEELGEQDPHGGAVEELRRMAAEKDLPPEVRTRADAEIDRLARMSPMAGEVATVRNYLDLLLELPWRAGAPGEIDVDAAQRVLDAEHFGLTEVKERILDYLALCRVRGQARGVILCLVGPPGVGKTSLVRSVARALDRKLVRIALGGIKDEGEIRGHRRVYVGAQPGRFIQGIRDARSRNPVMLLDEVDKLAADFRGDPAAALLEVLDPEQNSAFRDHFLEVPFDLSDTIFIATANDISRIPAPLRDRMEVIRLPAYTEEEKTAIALLHLLPRQLQEHGIGPEQLSLNEEAVRALLRHYTREAGVRELDRKIAQLCRKALRSVLTAPGRTLQITADNVEELLGARRPYIRTLPDEPQVGVCLGLSVSDAGGSVMPLEVLVMPGNGKLLLTGSLGDMMRDSAQAAFSWVRANAAALQIPADVHERCDIHLHIAGGATKNGTSGGVAIAVAMVSALTGRPVRTDVAMTGEVTLRGRVLPVGGVRDKAMAACREGIRHVVVPHLNAGELEDLPPSVRGAVEILPVSSLWEVVPQVIAGPVQTTGVRLA